MPREDINTKIEDKLVGSAKEKRIRLTQRDFKKAVSDDETSQTEVKEGVKAYESNSWPEDIKTEREELKKPVGDIARFPNIVDVISGNQRQGRTEMSAFAFERDDFRTAEFANAYLKYRRQKQPLQHENSLGFQNGIITSRAHWEYFLKFNQKDGSLETIRVERPADEVYLERPFREYDGSDSPSTFHVQWTSIEQLEVIYGKVDKTKLEVRARESEERRVEKTHLEDEYMFPSDSDPDLFFNKETEQVRLIRRWQRRFKNVFRVWRPDADSLDNASLGVFDTKAEAKKEASKYLRASNIKNVNSDDMISEEEKEFFSYHVISGRLELEWQEEWGDFVPFVHFWCYWANGKSHGLWGRLKDETQHLNFLFAKLEERLGKIGWMPLLLEEDALSEGTDFETAMEHWRDGSGVELASGAISRNKVKVEQDQSLQSIGPYVALVQFFFDNMERKVGATNAFQGESPGANTAGIAIEKLQSKASAVVEPVFDNFRRSLKMDAQIEIKMLDRAFQKRRFFTTMKMERVLGGMIERAPEKDPLQDFGAQLQEGTISIPGSPEKQTFDVATILEKMALIEYDINIDETLSTQSLGISILQTIAQLGEVLPAPPDVLIDLLGFAGIPTSIVERWKAQIPQGLPATNGVPVNPLTNVGA